MFAQLLAHPGVVEEVAIGSRVGVMAFHGGSLEEGTDTIARAVAARSGASLYVVATPPDLRWHVPSRLVTADKSPRLATFLGHVETAVAVHGFGRDDLWASLLVGGRNRALADHVGEHLAAALPHYETVTDLDHIPPELRGLHPDNPVNRPPRAGVQLELPPRARGRGPRASPADTAALVAALATAVSTWPTARRR